jgi:tRNA dimethylallyltransferase
MIVGGTGLYIDTIYKNFSMPPAIEPNRAYRDELEAIEKNEKGKIRQMLDAIDPVSASQIHPHAIRYIIRALEIHHMTGQTKTDLVRTQPVRFPVCMISLTRDIQIANERIYTRVGEMLDM